MCNIITVLDDVYKKVNLIRKFLHDTQLTELKGNLSINEPKPKIILEITTFKQTANVIKVVI